MKFNGYVYYITRVANIPSIMERGILSFNGCEAQGLVHESFALDSVQQKRDIKSVPGGLPVHDYACLYFDARNKTMFKLCKTDKAFGEICVLVLKADGLLAIEGAVISDMNAAASMAGFYPATDSSVLDFSRIYAKYWTHPDDEADEILHGYQKCAELLVPHNVEPGHILGAFAQNEQMEAQLNPFFQKVVVKPSVFFR